MKFIVAPTTWKMSGNRSEFSRLCAFCKVPTENCLSTKREMHCPNQTVHGMSRAFSATHTFDIVIIHNDIIN